MNWNTKQEGPDLYLIECDNIILGSIVRLVVETWRVEVMWSGEGGDITGEFNSYEKALAFVQGVEAGLNRRGSYRLVEPVTVTANDYSYDGVIVSRFKKLSGAIRYVVEDDKGRLFIHNANQLGIEDGNGQKGHPDAGPAVEKASS